MDEFRDCFEMKMHKYSIIGLYSSSPKFPTFKVREGAINILRGGDLKSAAFGPKILPPPIFYRSGLHSPHF